MDLNYLYERQQVSLFMADNANCEQARSAHRGLAEGYGKKIAEEKSKVRPLQVA